MKNFFLFVFILFSACLSAALIFSTYQFRNIGPLAQEKIVLIPKGEGVLAMAGRLQQEEVITNRWIFIAFAKATHTGKILKAGEYQFSPHIKMSDVLAKVASGDIYKRSFTIPEGKTSFEIVQIINAVPNMKGEIRDIPLEGSMLPETYAYLAGDSRENKIKKMQADMQKFLTASWPARDSDLPFKTEVEALTLASIVEKETGVAGERPRVAGVFINRLKSNMPLQSDPTVIYGLNKGQNKNDGMGPLGRHLLTADLTVPNPYNTYLNPGLPPGPIANPGKASILAVLHPEKNNFLYFVANGTGGHVFAATLEEHNRNVSAWRQLRAGKNNP